MTVRRMALVESASGNVHNVIVYDDALDDEHQLPISPGFELIEDKPNTDRGEAEANCTRWDGQEFIIVPWFDRWPGEGGMNLSINHVTGEVQVNAPRNIVGRDATPSDAVRHGRAPSAAAGEPSGPVVRYLPSDQGPLTQARGAEIAAQRADRAAKGLGFGQRDPNPLRTP